MFSTLLLQHANSALIPKSVLHFRSNKKFTFHMHFLCLQSTACWWTSWKNFHFHQVSVMTWWLIVVDSSEEPPQTHLLNIFITPSLGLTLRLSSTHYFFKIILHTNTDLDWWTHILIWSWILIPTDLILTNNATMG